jgi:short-subunit dehydrogenase
MQELHYLDVITRRFCGYTKAMDKVILITGASTGIGLHTAKLFQSRNWKVAATMRSPEKAEELQRIADIECIRLDVTDVDSIKSAIATTLEKFGRIDAVVNNAGYGLAGPFEATSSDQIERQFATNVFGLMNVTREILPYFREQKRGYIVNVASVGGRITFPLYSLYHSTKWAVEGFSESLQHELEQFNIRVKIIEPGPIKTDFYDRSQDVATKEGLTVYDNLVARAMPNMQKAGEDAPDGSVVAEAIYKAVTDDSHRLRYNVNTKGMLLLRRLLPDRIFNGIIKRVILR